MTEKIGKQPIWESSIRPLYPKCVWVEGGSYRNFIVDHDITRRQRLCAGWNSIPERRTFSCDGIEEDMQSLRLIGSSEVKRHRRESNLSDSTLLTSHRHAWAHKHALDMPGSRHSFADQMTIDEETLRGDDKEYLSQSGGFRRDCSPVHNDEKRLNEEMDHSKNQLTERVLQWLDLAGRNVSNRGECEVEKSNASKRRILTASEAQRKKSIQIVHSSPKHIPIQPAAQATPLRRTESVHHLSLTFNDDETFQSPVKCTTEVPPDRPALSFGEFFPTTYRCSRKFLAFRNGPSKVRSAVSLGGRASKEPDSGRKSFRSKPKRMESFENQYRSMIQRQILENSCNTQLAKRQLHIFMPSLPKKPIVTPLSNGNSGDCDSCLSTILSSGVAR